MRIALWILLGCLALLPTAHAQPASDCPTRCTKDCIEKADATDPYATLRCSVLCKKTCRRQTLRCHRQCEMQHIRDLRSCNTQPPAQQAACRLLATQQQQRCKQTCPPLPPKPAVSPLCIALCKETQQRSTQTCITINDPTQRKACRIRSKQAFQHCLRHCHTTH
ncbi:hypothetical protein L6R29_10525 [Myxococcota bacterium]|nr:hypothetical protein [Myxococcota bacterium]